MSHAIDITGFMTRFHELEDELDLFNRRDGGERWWDAVRLDSCYFLYDSITGLTYAAAKPTLSRSRHLGMLWRFTARRLLFARSAIAPRNTLVLRLPRLVVDGRRHDVILDALIPLLPARSRVVNTAPRRYHIPLCDQFSGHRADPVDCAEITQALIRAYDLPATKKDELRALIASKWSRHRCEVTGYNQLFDRLRPASVLTVGIDKPLFQVARDRNVVVAEVQHGLIAHGHPAYSYSRSVDPRHAALPSMFLTFSDYWQRTTYYPVARQITIGTDHLGQGIGPLKRSIGDVMIVSADIYHADLIDLTRAIATRLPERHCIYKLHPNQAGDAVAITAAIADLPNVSIGDPLVPASRLMADVSHLVAIQSTVVHEALQHGRSVCLVPRHDYGIHADLFDLPAVSVPPTTDAMVSALERPALASHKPVFFEPLNTTRATEALAQLSGTLA